MFAHIPDTVHGLDVATLSIKDNAYPVAISVTTYDVVNLKAVGASAVFCRTDDEKAKAVFDFNEGTLKWWKGSSDTSPSNEAYIETFEKVCGVYVPDALTTVSEYLSKYWRNNKQVIASKTPTFDTTILINACNVCNVKTFPMLSSPTLIDNAHTALRALGFLGMEPNTAVEKDIWSKTGNHLDHYAPHESAQAGYVVARYYHLLYLLRHSTELAKEAHDLMVQGKYDYVDFSLKHKDVLIRETTND